MSDSPEFQDRPTRRRFLTGLSAAGIGGLAGCGFGGDGNETTIPPITTLPPERTPTETPTSTATPTPTEEHPTTTQPTTTDGFIEGRTWRMFVPPPKPAGVDYAGRWWFDGDQMMELNLFQWSHADQRLVPEAVRDWSYTKGVLMIELHDDLYWASDSAETRAPTNVTAADWQRGMWEFAQFFWPDTFPQITESEQLGEYRFRVFADYEYPDLKFLYDNLHHFRLQNNAFYEPHLAAYREATTEQERNEIETELFDAGTGTPHPFTNTPFRVDGTQEDRWRLTLRNDEDPVPRWVDRLTFDTVAIVVREDITRQTQAFVQGRLPFAVSRTHSTSNHIDTPFDPAVVDADTTFSTTTVEIAPPHAPAAYTFNFGQSPSSDPHFRRAFAYLLNREQHSTRFMHPDHIPTGLLTESQEAKWISDSVDEQLRSGPHHNYGVNSVNRELAAAELRAGGFERDSAGNWLYTTGDRAGEPMAFEVVALEGLGRVIKNAAEFQTTLREFGIETTVVSGNETGKDLDAGDFEIGLTHWGARRPGRCWSIRWRRSVGAGGR